MEKQTAIALVRYLVEVQNVPVKTIAHVTGISYDKIRNMAKQGRAVSPTITEVTAILDNFYSLLPMSEEVFPIADKEGRTILNDRFWNWCRERVMPSEGYGEDVNKVLLDQIKYLKEVYAKASERIDELEKAAAEKEQKKRIPAVGSMLF